MIWITNRDHATIMPFGPELFPIQVQEVPFHHHFYESVRSSYEQVAGPQSDDHSWNRQASINRALRISYEAGAALQSLSYLIRCLFSGLWKKLKVCRGKWYRNC